MANRDGGRDDGEGALPPFPVVPPASEEELARLREARRFWDRPEVRQWIATGKWPDEDGGEGGTDDE